jgi:hypothetical protein
VPGSNYTSVAHARVPGEDPDLVWLAIGRWTYPDDGNTEWFLELWEAQGDAGDDIAVEDAESAKALTLERYGVPVDAWVQRPQRFSR